jgi:DNA polymerase
MFDGAILSWHYGLRAGTYLCTQAMCRALWNQQSSSLDNLTKLCFPDDPTKRKGKEIMQFKDVWELGLHQRSVLMNYCINDVNLTYDCFMYMNRFFPSGELKLINMALRSFIHPPLVADVERMETYRVAKQQEVDEAIEASGLSATKLKSNKQFAEWILENGMEFEQIPSPTPKNPENMKWPLAKTDKEFLDLQAEHPEFAHVWKGRKLAASPGELRRVERLITHANLLNRKVAVPLNYCAAHTFRYGGTNKVNFQNFKRGSEIRYSLLAPDGYQVVVQDLSNIEARMLAWLAKEDKLLLAYANKEDVYSKFASTVFHQPINKEDHPTERFVGKTCILGLGYQTGELKLKHTLFLAGLIFTLRQCYDMKMLYRTQYAKIPALWRHAESMIFHMTRKDAEPIEWGPMVVEYQRIRMPNGLYLNFPGIRMGYDEAGRSTGHEYWNGKFWTNIYGGKLVENVIQCLSRILMAEAMLQIDEELCIMGGQVALTVHDELVGVAPTERAEEANSRMAEILKVPPQWCNDGSLTLDTEGGYAQNYSK